MSTIGDSIQNSLASTPAALREQQAALSAEADEQARRHNRIRREEELAREGIRQADRSTGERVHAARSRAGGKRRSCADDSGAPGDDAARDGHIDFLA